MATKSLHERPEPSDGWEVIGHELLMPTQEVTAQLDSIRFLLLLNLAALTIIGIILLTRS